MISPCKGICILDTQGIFCTGCFRTIEQIKMWRDLSTEQKEKIINELMRNKNGK